MPPPRRSRDQILDLLLAMRDGEPVIQGVERLRLFDELRGA